MPMLPAGSTRRFWETRASLLALRLNVAAWLDRFGPVLFAVTSAAAVAVYALRRVRGPVEWGWSGFAIVLVGAALGVLMVARRKFFSAAEARVLLESELRLDTRLTAAASEFVAWPAVPQPFPDVLRWQLRAPAGWLAGAFAILLLAAWAPVPELTTLAHPTEKPPSLAQTEALLKALSEAKVADSSAVEQIAERARELASRPAEEQYSHSALEAADALRDQTTAAVAALGRNLADASSALRSAEKDPANKAAAGQLSSALSGLREGGLPADSSLMRQLANGALSDLSPEQLKALAQQLAEAAKRTQGVLGAAGAGANIAQPDPNSKLGPGQQGAPGGEGGGNQSAPLGLAKDASDAGDGKAEALKASLDHLAIGDKLGTTAGAHEVDPAKAVGPVSAGAIAAPAKGGEAVWVNRLTPAERAALKDFYK